MNETARHVDRFPFLSRREALDEELAAADRLDLRAALSLRKRVDPEKRALPGHELLRRTHVAIEGRDGARLQLGGDSGRRTRA
jgi:hypothetical protein